MDADIARWLKKRDELRGQVDWLKSSGTRVFGPSRDVTDDWLLMMEDQIRSIEKFLSGIGDNA